MFSTSHDDKHVVHEKMKSRVKAFNCGILHKGQQRLWDRGREKDVLIMNGMFNLTG